MRKSRFTDEQIAIALRQAEAGTPVADICRKLGITEATFYRWKRKFGSLGVPERWELRQLREEVHLELRAAPIRVSRPSSRSCATTCCTRLLGASGNRAASSFIVNGSGRSSSAAARIRLR